MTQTQSSLRKTLVTINREIQKLVTARGALNEALTIYQPGRITTRGITTRGTATNTTITSPPKRTMSTKAKAAIAKAQKARWAKYHRENGRKVVQMRKAA